MTSIILSWIEFNISLKFSLYLKLFYPLKNLITYFIAFDIANAFFSHVYFRWTIYTIKTNKQKHLSYQNLTVKDFTNVWMTNNFPSTIY